MNEVLLKVPKGSGMIKPIPKGNQYNSLAILHVLNNSCVADGGGAASSDTNSFTNPFGLL
jgi:hypothetical protein